MTTFLKWNQVHALTGKSRTTIWRWEGQGHFPKRRQIGPKSVAWVEQEVADWANNTKVVP